MDHLSVAETAARWGVSARTVRGYCAAGRIPGAVREGKTWRIPADACRPERSNGKQKAPRTLLEVLRAEKAGGIKGGIYHKIQVELTYNSNHIEGSRLTHDQTRYIYETNTIGLTDGVLDVDDIVETANHFKCIDMVIDAAKQPLSETFLKRLHQTLKNGTRDARRDWFAVGAYKTLPNEVGGQETTPPERVAEEMRALLARYAEEKDKDLEDLIAFHHDFEAIHPFQDGNGRVGRLVLFKECLRYDIVPFIIDDDLKLFYYRGLHEWGRERGYLLDTCMMAQDRFKQYLDYFHITYEGD